MIRTDVEHKRAIRELERHEEQIKLEAAQLAKEGLSAEETRRATPEPSGHHG